MREATDSQRINEYAHIASVYPLRRRHPLPALTFIRERLMLYAIPAQGVSIVPPSLHRRRGRRGSRQDHSGPARQQRLQRRASAGSLRREPVSLRLLQRSRALCVPDADLLSAQPVSSTRPPPRERRCSESLRLALYLRTTP